MAKTPIIKGGLITGRHSVTGQSKGGEALESQHYVARDGSGQIAGISTTRYHVVKPTADSGSVGAGTAIRTNSGGKEQQANSTNLQMRGPGRIYKVTKPSKGR